MERNALPVIRCSLLFESSSPVRIIKDLLKEAEMENVTIITPRTSRKKIYEIKSVEVQTWYLDEALNNLFLVVNENIYKLAKSIQLAQCKTIVDIWIDYDDVHPALIISKDNLQKINMLNASISIDYV